VLIGLSVSRDNTPFIALSQWQQITVRAAICELSQETAAIELTWLSARRQLGSRPDECRGAKCT
jgi:hypothetical protein